MNSPCETCAFGQHGAANEPENQLVSILAVAGAIPFWCHHGRNGVEYDSQSYPLGPMSLPAENRKVCAGWQREVKRLKSEGFYAEYLPVRRAIARHAIGLINRALLPGIGRVKRKEAFKAIRRCARFLCTRDIAKEPIPL